MKKNKNNAVAEICESLGDCKKKNKLMKEVKKSNTDKPANHNKMDFGPSIKKDKRAILKRCKEYAKILVKVDEPEKIAKKLKALGFDVDISRCSIGVTINVPIKHNAKKTIDKSKSSETPSLKENASKKKRGRPKKVVPEVDDVSVEDEVEPISQDDSEVVDKPEVELVPVGDTFTDEALPEVNENEVSEEEMFGTDDEQPSENENDEYDEIDRDPDADFFESRAEAFSRMNDDGEFED